MRGEKTELQKLVVQFCSYFCVGGVAALVEWLTFYLFCYVCALWYVAATVLAFLISTLVNYLLGRRWTFKAQSRNEKILKEAVAVYAASAIGMVLNLILMYVFVDFLALPALLSKIGSTGLVFIWNFLSRRCLIYKKFQEVEYEIHSTK